MQQPLKPLQSLPPLQLQPSLLLPGATHSVYKYIEM
jgi:hypothetical protein